MLAKLLLHKGHYNEAINFVENALNLKQSLNETAHNYLLLGILYDLKNERKSALSFYQKVDELANREPEDSWFRVNRVVEAYSKKYSIKPFTKKNLKERCVFIDYSQGSGVE